MEIMDREFCKIFWEDDEFDWAYKGSTGMSGGLLCTWRSSCFIMESCLDRTGALEIKGFWGENKVKCSVVLRACAEREILNMLDHPFLPALYASFQTKTHICLITDYCPGGELFLLLDRQPTKVLKEDSVSKENNATNVSDDRKPGQKPDLANDDLGQRPFNRPIVFPVVDLEHIWATSVLWLYSYSCLLEIGAWLIHPR
ncbi:hypothetical protein ACS0TY_018654 [Phlomoides rotata]